MCWIMLIGGLIMVIVGARALIPAASEVAIRFGVAEDIIAATLVAFGTSLPELMTAITAIRKGHPDIVVGEYHRSRHPELPFCHRCCRHCEIVSYTK